MRKLERCLLIHWHNFEKEVVEFDDINFLTGKTASGKSTIIDAMQLVLLGDASGRYFNKAANERSNRTLNGYLYGEIGDNEEAGFRYARTGRFTTYIVLEFLNTEKDRKFCLGAVFDCPEDRSEPDRRWLILHRRGLPDNLFVDEATRRPLTIPQLRTFLAKWTGGGEDEWELVNANAEFRSKSRLLFGRVDEKYRLLLRKAVPFKPIENIKQFITESVCEVSNAVDIDEMQNDIRSYRGLEEEATLIQRKIEALSKIAETTARYAKAREKLDRQLYIVHRAAQEESLGEAARAAGEADALEARAAALEEEGRRVEEETQGLRREREDLVFDLRNSKEYLAVSRLDEEIARLQEGIAPLEKGIRAAASKIALCAGAWSPILAALGDLGLDAGEEFAALVRDMKLARPEDVGSFDFVRAAALFAEACDALSAQLAGSEARRREASDGRRALEERIRKLESGIKPFPPDVRNLKAEIEGEINDAFGEEVELGVLSDALDLEDEAWRDAVESLIQDEKFYLLAPESYLDFALDVLKREEPYGNKSHIGIVDCRGLESRPPRAGLASAASILRAEGGSQASRYIASLLGGVGLASSLEEARGASPALTEDGILVRDGEVSRLEKVEPFIGQMSTKLLLEKAREELAAKAEEERRLREVCLRLQEAKAAVVIERYEAQEHQRAAGQIPRLEEMRALLEERRKEREEARESLFYIEKMKSRIAALEKRIDACATKARELLTRQAETGQKAATIRGTDIPALEAAARGEEDFIRERFTADWVAETGEAAFAKALESGSEKAVSERYQNAMRQTEALISNLASERRQARVRYVSEFQVSYDTEAESNKEFDQALEELRGNLLPEYLEKIGQAKKAAYDRFRDDFISKIKLNIEECRKQIRDLNRALGDSVFGTDKYRFEVKAAPDYKEFYDMFMDPMLMDTEGPGIWGDAFNQKYKSQIDRLFEMLVVSDSELSGKRAQERERNIRTYTDYRSYLSFDLMVTDVKSGNVQHLSKTLLRKSGGETQVPFYIAILASFSQVCRIRSAKDNDTIRLIILDEAFSKMDGERIRVSIELLKQFGLQAVFSAPPEKIQDISLLVDRTIIVFKDGRRAFTRLYDPGQGRGTEA